MNGGPPFPPDATAVWTRYDPAQHAATRIPYPTGRVGLPARQQQYRCEATNAAAAFPPAWNGQHAASRLAAPATSNQPGIATRQSVAMYQPDSRTGGNPMRCYGAYQVGQQGVTAAQDCSGSIKAHNSAYGELDMGAGQVSCNNRVSELHVLLSTL